VGWSGIFAKHNIGQPGIGTNVPYGAADVPGVPAMERSIKDIMERLIRASLSVSAIFR
jgi:hypothetical protein